MSLNERVNQGFDWLGSTFRPGEFRRHVVAVCVALLGGWLLGSHLAGTPYFLGAIGLLLIVALFGPSVIRRWRNKRGRLPTDLLDFMVSSVREELQRSGRLDIAETILNLLKSVPRWCCDGAIELKTPTQVTAGWSPFNVAVFAISDSTTHFPIPAPLQQEYRHSVERFKEKERLYDDRTKVDLSRLPIETSTDSPTLKLETARVLYSVSRFYQRKFETADGRTELDANGMLRDLFVFGKVRFPNSMSVQLIIETSDHCILFMHRSESVQYYRKHWSVSIEESLNADESLIDTTWWADSIRRTLREELGLTEVAGDFRIEDFRILSIFFQIEVFNVDFCCYLPILLTTSDVLARGFLDRQDDEFQGFEFIQLEKVAQELLRPTRLYHPTSRYRMFCLLRHRGRLPTDRTLHR